MAGQLQGIIVFSRPNYAPERWHTTLIMWFVVLVAWMQNIWGIKLLPMFQLFAGGLHILMFVVFCVVMLVMGRNANAKFVFTSFVNETGWENSTVAWFIGLLPSIWCVIGKCSCSAHSCQSLISRQDSTVLFTSVKKRPTPPTPFRKLLYTLFSSTVLWHSFSCLPLSSASPTYLKSSARQLDFL